MRQRIRDDRFAGLESFRRRMRSQTFQQSMQDATLQILEFVRRDGEEAFAARPLRDAGFAIVGSEIAQGFDRELEAFREFVEVVSKSMNQSIPHPTQATEKDHDSPLSHEKTGRMWCSDPACLA